MKKYALYTILIYTAALGLHVSAQVGDIDPQGDASCVEIRNNLRYGSRDASTNGEVTVLQDYLQASGYMSTNPTGFFGLLTKNALIKFQRTNGISPTGYLGPQTRQHIKAASCSSAGITVTTPAPAVQAPIQIQVPQYTNTPSAYVNVTTSVSQGSTGQDVVALQNFLLAKRYLAPGVDAPGVFGEATKAALIRYQTNNRITPADGYAGALTRMNINSGVDSQGYEQSVPAIQVVNAPVPVTATPTYVNNPSTSVNVASNVGYGSQNADVVALQNYLIAKGYMRQGQDTPGLFGEATKGALTTYQLNNGIVPADGYAGPLTRASINANADSQSGVKKTITSNLRMGSDGSEVTILQNFLISRSYMVSGLDRPGLFGVATDAGLKNYQSSKGITPDGVTGAITRSNINAEL